MRLLSRYPPLCGSLASVDKPRCVVHVLFFLDFHFGSESSMVATDQIKIDQIKIEGDPYQTESLGGGGGLKFRFSFHNTDSPSSKAMCHILSQ